MANPIAKDQLATLPAKPYGELRNSLRSGDLFFCSGQYLVSRAIQMMTKSPWSHVGMIFRVDSIDRVLLLESVEDMGVRFAPLSKYLNDYDNGKPYAGVLAVGRHSQVDDSKIAPMAEFGTDELTRPYNKEEIGMILARITLGIGRETGERRYICSELVDECLKKSGISVPRKDPVFVSPEDVWKDQQVKLVSRIVA